MRLLVCLTRVLISLASGAVGLRDVRRLCPHWRFGGVRLRPHQSARAALRSRPAVARRRFHDRRHRVVVAVAPAAHTPLGTRVTAFRRSANRYMAPVVKSARLSATEFFFLNSSVASATGNGGIVRQAASESFASGVRDSAAHGAVSEAAPNSYTRSSRSTRQRLAPIHGDQVPSIPSKGFWFSCVGRLRIISVPCGGLSWRRDRLPKDDGELPAKSLGIESRADSGRRGYTASSQLGAARRPGLLGTMVVFGRVVPSPVTGGASHPNATGSGLRRMESSRVCQRRDWLSLLRSPDWRSPLAPQLGCQLAPPGRVNSSRTSSGQTAAVCARRYTARAISAARMPNALALLPHFWVLRCSQRLAGSWQRSIRHAASPKAQRR